VAPGRGFTAWGMVRRHWRDRHSGATMPAGHYQNAAMFAPFLTPFNGALSHCALQGTIPGNGTFTLHNAAYLPTGALIAG
jgi:hypothetical protein